MEGNGIEIDQIDDKKNFFEYFSVTLCTTMSAVELEICLKSDSTNSFIP